MGLSANVVVTHGDCDGIISAYLYIKHFMRDSWPSKISIIFTQPWRAHIDLRKSPSEVDEVVLLDLALSRELSVVLTEMAGKTRKLTFIDHHISSLEFVNELRKLSSSKIICEKAQSCPRLMSQALKISLNPYEQLLIDVADVCEGSEAQNPEVARLADIIKLSIARDPGDYAFMSHLINVFMNSKDVASDAITSHKYRVAKFLLSRLLKIMSERALSYGNFKIVSLTLPESRIFAGLLGIGTTEFARLSRNDVILIRREEDKVVVTARTLSDRAFRVCREIAKLGKGRFGGHAEAASATLPDMSIQDAVNLTVQAIKNL
ncbi:MAG: hypothetical protein B7O98_01970 [Zestosphaera tikiterensis]|uniref:DHHA1 domain-containing protein n=1 Tax=Zestosphaera tikiterensis TaxID=1973259 RepID=A0A2R7Y6Q7_9CREN|nr:MAG: hypothetical protein B7O98_01970 [Zestosphaera tikiterensis]